MHPAIGQLNGGRYYAYVNGYAAEPVIRDNPQVLERMLAGEPEPEQRSVSPGQAKTADARRRARTMKDYLVSIRLKYPSIDHAGCELPIAAYSKKEAIAKARQQVRSQLLYDRHDGPLIYSAQRRPG